MKKSILVLTLGIIFSSVPIKSQDDSVEEVIVTATKTERTLQEVPVAVSVVTQKQLRKLM